ncbi:nitrite/sulfite reductase [Alkalimarinus coralli]|uniref:nitrite/sulfite reductase n=1 Tax=Alkalimarinus coralli TaxID=2935863 RepID=UPI00202B1390|nr:nitrite/sulfite reductase [Alkalimarinus coralli]
MYQYSEQDYQQLSDRLAMFNTQIQRHIDGKLSDDEFRPLRLQNGLYFQLHAPMLRVAVPYGMLSSNQLRKLAYIAQTFDKGYCHVSTRQNIQFNWPELDNIPTILNALAEAEMHATQTSGNCIRNVTSDPFAGVAPDEIIDPRPFCEIIRQWSTGHPEFAYLPRKFKIAVFGSQQDRAIVEAHDIGLQLAKSPQGDIGFKVWVGGGLGRTPVIGSILNEFIPQYDLLDYLQAILRIYNQFGRRDNKYKARIKILVRSLGIEQFKKQVEEEWKRSSQFSNPLTDEDLNFAHSFFSAPCYQSFDSTPDEQLRIHTQADPLFENWVKHNTRPHKVTGYRSVTVSLKSPGVAPGDISSEQLEALANIAEKYSYGEVRTTHQQNMVLADVAILDLFPLWKALSDVGLATANIGTLTDMIVCPGLDYCSLANAQSIPVAEAIRSRFDNMDYLYDIGDVTLNISGCVNACAHHHLANIGILGVDKKGEQYYQVSLGGDKTSHCRLGKILGPAFSKEQIPFVVEFIIKIFIQHRHEGESFIATLDRVGLATFKETVYGNAH